ncbi:MAG: hypothetical protein WKF47_16485 [Geodermatophilaceae bacterium]
MTRIAPTASQPRRYLTPRVGRTTTSRSGTSTPSGAGALPTETRSSLTRTMFVLGADGDDMRSWLIAGQALGRVLLELTSAGFVSSILSQVVEVPKTRDQLHHELRLAGQPQLLLRVGVAEPTPASPRRPLDDVITTGPAASADGQHGIAKRSV